MNRKNLRIKLALLFLAIMALASFCSFVVSAITTNLYIQTEIMAGQALIAESMRKLNNRTDMTVDEIIDVTSDNSYIVKVRENLQGLRLKDSEYERLMNNEIVFVRRGYYSLGRTLFFIDNSLIEISVNFRNSIFLRNELRKGLTLIFSVVIGTTIIAIAGKRILRHIRALNEATREVAKGNFDVRIEEISDDEIGQLTVSFNKMAAELKSIELLRNDFISNVSHEFKTPIALIQGFARLLQSDSLTDEERREYTQIIVDESERLSRLSSNILKLSKLENQEIVVEKTSFSLDEQIRRTILLLEPKWSKKNIEFNIELENIKYYGSEELLQQIWLNLIDNAVKFTGENGEIAVKLYDTGSSIKVRIVDNGIGMDDRTMKRIYEKFYQGDKAHSSEGSGLGLSLVKRIVELCGGKISVKSVKGKGSTFVVELPATK